MGPDPTGLDACKPTEIMRLVEEAGITKTQLAMSHVLALAVLAGGTALADRAARQHPGPDIQPRHVRMAGRSPA